MRGADPGRVPARPADRARLRHSSLPEFRGDREQLIQAVLNIVRNAAQALAERIAAGDAQIRLAHARRAPGDARQAALSAGTGIAVEDNGPGVPEAIRDRIFYPLVSGREGGSGLGLTLAQTFVAAAPRH